MNTLMKLSIALLLPLWLASCNAPAQRAEGTPGGADLSAGSVPVKFTVDAGKGYVIFKNYECCTFPLVRFSLSTLTLTNKETGSTIKLRGSGERLSDSTYFVGTLEPGVYALSSYERVRTEFETTGRREITSTVNFDQTGTFAVAAGSITNLGTFVLRSGDAGPTRYSGIRYSSTGYNVRIYNDQTSQADLQSIISAIRTKAQLLSDSPVLGWSGAASPFLPLALEQKKENLQGAWFNAPITIGGVIYAGEDLGLIRARNKDGRWDWIDTGLVGNVLAIDAYADGSLVAGAASGALSLREAGVKQWKQIPLPLAGGLVRYIGHSNGLGVIVVVQLGQSNLVVLSTPSLSNPQWRRINSFSSGKNYDSCSADTDIRYTIDDRTFTVSSLSSGQLTLDAATGQWTKTAEPMSSPSRWAKLQIVTGGLAFAVADYKNFMASVDGGKTWEKRSTFNDEGVFSFIMQDENTGYAYQYKKEGKTIQDIVWQTRDGARTWQIIRSAPGRNILKVMLFPDNQLVLPGISRKDGFFTYDAKTQTWTQHDDERIRALGTAPL